MPFSVTEISGLLRQSGQVTLSAAGVGTIYLQPTSSHQRWEVNKIDVQNSQPANATVVPTVTIALNSNDLTTLSQANYRGTSWNGNQDSWGGQLDVGPCDFLALIFAPPPGSTPAQIATLAGVICGAAVTGTKYTRVG